ncbi:MAG: chemotaxis protein CheW [Polyangiales bacterium]
MHLTYPAPMDSDAELFDDDDDGHVEDTFLTFHVADEEYAVPVAHVTEIVRLQKTYAMPDVPDYIRGVINLRGKVIPLLDVRSRFGLSETGYTDRTVVVVLDLDETVTGLVVDGVSEVVEIPPSEIEPAGRSQNQRQKPMVKGLGKRENRVCFILDVNALLDTQLPALEALPAVAAGTQVS